MPSSTDGMRSMVLAFRMNELQTLMIYAGRSKTGKKTDLQNRAIELVRLNSPDINSKIRELSTAMYKSLGSAPSVNPYSSSYSTPPPSSPSRATSSTSSSKPGPDPPPSSHHLVYPTYPDVTLQKLPFYRIESTLLKPCSLQPNGNARFQEQTFTFHLTPQQASDISNSSYRDENNRVDYRKQIQMRFSLLETSCEQEDNFPSSICVKANSRLCPLPNPIPTNKPGAEPKRPPKPINITALCKLSATTANCVNVSWAVEVGRGYTVSVYLVDKLSYVDLLQQLKTKGHRQPDYTRALIKEKLNDQDTEIATTSCKVSLACPLGKMRMKIPCRASTCDHLQCFDASLYLQMNEKKPKWRCPVCNKTALNDNLLIDGFFMELIVSPRLPDDEHEIVLHNDASWDPLPPRKDTSENIATPAKPPPPPEIKTKRVETFSVDDDGEEDDSSVGPAKAISSSSTASSSNGVSGVAAAKRPADVSIDCITLDSDSDTDCQDEGVPSSLRPPSPLYAYSQPGSKRPRTDVDSPVTLSSTTPTPPGTPAYNFSESQGSPALITLSDDDD